MKKTVTLWAALCCSVLAATAADFRVDDLSYTILDNVNHYVALDTTHSPTGVTELTIPSTVVYNSTTYTVTQTAIDCFKSGSLTKLTIPSTIDSLKNWFCGEQRGLQEVNFSEGLVYIGDQAFREVNKVERLIFPNSLKKIDDFAFIEGTGLKHVTFGTGIERIAYFYQYNTTLESITINAITPPTIFYTAGTKTFGASAYTNAVLYVPASTGQTILAAYSAATGWSNFADIREITETPKVYHKFSVATTNGSYGTVKIDNVVKTNGSFMSIEENTPVKITIIPSEGKEVTSVKLGTTDITASFVSNEYTLPAMLKDTTLHVQFDKTNYTVTVAVEGSGAYTEHAFYYDEMFRMSTIANSTFAIDDIKVDGISVSNVTLAIVFAVQKNVSVVITTKTSASGVPIIKSGNLTTWHAEGSVFVENTEAMRQVEVIDLQGRTVRVQKGNGNLFVLPYAENGGYILRVTNTAGQVSSIKGLCRN